ncbi:MAG: hypothetical protein HW390_3573, partial [Candidatus Brocadiaceae bacterium]|nr:hypothetical protein [Candidatus Brocadiaceae bacterium]
HSKLAKKHALMAKQNDTLAVRPEGLEV